MIEIVVLLAVLLLMICLYRRAWIELEAMKRDRQSILTKHGKSIEQFIPFLKNYPYEKGNFRFIGTPIDGLQFEPDRVIFVEFKTGDSKLTTKQKGIKDLILNRKVEFKEVRI